LVAGGRRSGGAPQSPQLGTIKAEYFLVARLDSQNQIEAVAQIAIWRACDFSERQAGKRSVARENARLICPTGKSARSRHQNLAARIARADEVIK
jgi:hypothetical protein